MDDVRYAIRKMLKAPLFTAVAVLTLAIGIGANAAIYTVVEAVLLEPLPYEEPDELIVLWTRNDEAGQDRYMVSPMDFDDWRNNSTTFEAMSAFWPTTGTVTEAEGDPVRVNVVYTTEDYFSLLGVNPLSGRTLGPDDGPGSAQVVVLSEGFWQRRFGGDPRIVGQTILLDGTALEVVGIVPGRQTHPEGTDVFTNMTWPMQIQARAARWMSALGRLQEGTSMEIAQSDMVSVARGIEELYPASNSGWTVTMAPLTEVKVGDTRTALLVLLGATGLILFIACATVANLLLSRSEVRASEMAVRVAFGAPRGRLVRQLLTESLVLSLAGAALGLLIARIGVDLLLRIAPVTLPTEVSIGIDGTVLAVVLGVTLLTGVLFGLAPVVRLLSDDVHTTLRQGGRGAAGRGGHGLQRGFVVAQFALALILAVGAGLLVDSFRNLRAIDTGFVASGVLTAELDLSPAAAPDDRDVMNLYDQFRRRIAELPGVEAVGDASTLPLSEALDYAQVVPLVDRELPEGVEARVFLRPVAPGFFDAMRTPVMAGRIFDDRDRLDAPGAVVVNEAFVRRFYPDVDPVGERIGNIQQRWGPLGELHISGDIRESEIIGVVKDMRYDGLREDVPPALYVSGLQSSIRRRTVVVRTMGEPSALVGPMRSALSELNPGVALTRVRAMSDVVADARSRDRFSTLLLGAFGAIALFLAAIGVYGVLAYAVEQRTGEVGIRMALGADRADVRSLILGDGMRLVAAGLGLGLVAALVLSGTLSSLLFGVQPRDPTVYGIVLLVLALVGLAASLIPAMRATRVDPLTAMRAE
ncbi:MAG: ABC transporter permease [Gemmatimonadetes bacterium]|nr:ABC transporter permease [Gemmatimonadota bacterium]